MTHPLDPAALLAAFASAFTQHQRLIKFRFSPSVSLTEDTLLPWTLTGSEAINEGFRYVLTCLSPDAQIELKHLIGQPVEVSILTDTSDYRPICGWVTEARQNGADGGMARYTLVIEDVFALLSRRINNRIQQEISAKDAVLTILYEHQTNPVLADSFDIDDRTTQDYPVQALIGQFDESDAAFIQRKLADEGIGYYFEYGDAGQCSDRPKATLVLFDDNSQLPDNPAGMVRYHRADGAEDTDAITQWTSQRSLAPGSVYRVSPDYKPLSLDQQQDTSRLNQGDTGNALAATLDDYRYEPPRYGQNPDDYARLTTLRMQAHEYAAKQFTGTGTVRAFTIGRFQLADHPEIDQHDELDREFILTKVSLNAQNNLPPEVNDQAARLLAPSNTPSPSQGEGRGGDQKNASPFTNEFTATRHTLRIVAHPHPRPAPPQQLTGIVVGPEAEEIYTDNLGRIKVNFQYPRASDHQTGGASYNHTDSPWLRVLQTWASSEYGALFLPRVGDEVNISFINNDIDRPLVMGTVYNGTHKPATFSHTGNLPGNKTLSGIKSKMYKGAGANELLLDDTTHEQRIRLATDHAKTELNQGYLVHPRDEGKGSPRGEGFELRTDAAGALRAALGLLVSTDFRRKASGSQLDRQEFMAQIELAQSLVKNLSELSSTHHAEDTDSQPQDELVEHIRHWEDGSNTDPSTSPSPSQGEGRGGDQTGGAPIIALSGQAGIAVSTPQNATLTTGTNLDMVATQDTSITAGRSFKARAKEMISLFAYKLGMKLVAAGGRIKIEAHSDNIEITAAKKVILTGLEGIALNAPKITYIAQGAGTSWGEGQITYRTVGAHTVHAADHKVTGPAGAELVLPVMPISEETGYSQRIIVINPIDGSPRELPYKVYKDAGVLDEGDTSAGAQIERKLSHKPDPLTALIGAKQKWSANYLTSDTPFPIDRDETGQ